MFQQFYIAAAACCWPMDQFESESILWKKCARCCPCTRRRFRSCRSHHTHPRPARRSDGGSSDTSLPVSNRSRPLSTGGKNGNYFNGDFDTTSFAVNVNNFWLSDLVLCSKTKTALFRATLLILVFVNFVFILLYFTILNLISNRYKVKIAMTAMT